MLSDEGWEGTDPRPGPAVAEALGAVAGVQLLGTMAFVALIAVVSLAIGGNAMITLVMACSLPIFVFLKSRPLENAPVENAPPGARSRQLERAPASSIARAGEASGLCRADSGSVGRTLVFVAAFEVRL